MSKNILILTPFYPPNIGGAETFTEGLVKEASKCFNISVLTFQPFATKVKKYEGWNYKCGSLKIYRRNWWVKQSSAWRGVSLRNALSVIPSMALNSLLLCLKNRFDIVHGQGLLSGFVAVLLKKIFRTKAYMTLLALYEFKRWPQGFRKNIVKWIMKNSDCIFVEGFNGVKDLESVGGFCKKVVIFNHWVDQEKFKPFPFIRHVDKTRVLFVGRPTKEKGRNIVEEAQTLLNKENYEFSYVDNIPYEELPKHYQMAHVVCVPSLYAEGFSRVVAEAASCGCAVITSDQGSLPEMVSGWGWVQPVERFRLCIALMNIGQTKEKWGNIAYKYAQQNFSPKNAEVFLKEYSA